MTPLLVLLFGIHPATAVGTDLLYAGITQMRRLRRAWLQGSIDWPIVRPAGHGQRPRRAHNVGAAAHGARNPGARRG